MFRKLLSFDEAKQVIEQNYSPKPVGVEQVPISEAHERVLAQDITSPIDIPSFTRSTVDGYAVKAADTFAASEEQPAADSSPPRRERGAGEARPDGEERQGRRGRGRRGGGSGGYGAVVGAGEFLFALTPDTELIVFQANAQAPTEVARYKVADGPTYSYPIVSGDRIFIKDKDTIALWSLQ